MSDPLFYDGAALRSLASEAILKRGIDYFREHRVTNLRVDDRRLTAAVDGSEPWPYDLVIEADDDDELLIDCSCPFDWEPACKHAVAALMAYAASQPVPEVAVDNAAGAAIEARVKRGRMQVAVKHVSGDAFFGTFEATSMGGGSGRAHRVRIVSLDERINHCTCADLATNQLGTCKHVEAVLHHLGRKRGAGRRRAEGPPHAVVHLGWDGPEAPEVRLREGHQPPPVEVARLFTDAGVLAGPQTDGIHALERLARSRDGLMVMPDVVEHARRLAEEAAHRERAAVLRARITASGGRLPGVRATLYPYQVQGVAFLVSAGRALLADDMGLGKTLQAISSATWMLGEGAVERVLVVCPASLKHQWSREIRRFTDQSVQVVEGPPAARLTQYRRKAAFTVVNYELVLRDHDVIQRQLAPDLQILDEAQRIKNWRTKTAAAIKALDTRYAFVLTGTPLENRLEDLYSLMQVVDPRVLGPLWRYLIDFHVTTESGRVVGYRNLAELRRRLGSVMLRRDRRLVRDQLPDRIDHRVDVALDKRQRALHDEALQTASTIVQAAARQGRPLTPTETHRLMAALQNARMACDAAGLVDKQSEGSPKLQEIARLLEELCLDGGHKVVVFSQWTGMTDRIEALAQGLGLGVAHLHGGVPTSRRGALIDRFHDDDGCQVFLSTDAGGVGLNLQCATALINVDVPWNPAVLEQRIARIHRLGQGEPVQIVHLVARGAYEGRVAELVESKRDLFRHTVTEDASEDVVGLSRRSLQTAIAALDPTLGEEAEEASSAEAEEAEEANAEAEAEAEDTALAGLEASANSGSPAGPELLEPDESVAPVLAALERVMPGRIERVLATGGGLLVVVGSSRPEDDGLVNSLGGTVPVAVVDAATAASLERIGALPGTPLARSRPDPLAKVRRALDAADALLEASCDAEAVGYLRAAALGLVAHAAGLDAPPAPEVAARWLHGEVVPSGAIDGDTAMLVTRTLVFADAPSVPDGLAASMLADLRRMSVAVTRVAG